MTRRPSHEAIVGGWLNDLAVLTAGNRSLEEAKIKVAALTGVLADAFPDDTTFSRESLAMIARQTTFLPSFAELHRMLGAWWETKRPRQLPAGLADAPMSGEDRAAAEVWLKAAFASASNAELAGRLAIIRTRLAPAYRWLIANNDHAASIAADKGWTGDERGVTTHAEDWGDPAKVLASVRNIVDPPHPLARVLLGFLRTAVEQHAPHNLGLVPTDLSAVYGAERADPVRAPSPEQRKTMNADDGIVLVERPPPDPAPAGRPAPGAMTDKHLLAMWEASGPTGQVRAAALRDKIAAAEKIIPFLVSGA